jgi:glutaminyl-tRNA synthetase
VKDPQSGQIKEIHCTYDPETRGGDAPDGRKVKATLHWVSAKHAIPAEIRLYDRLFTVPNPMEDREKDYKTHLNAKSLEILNDCCLEPSLGTVKPGESVQFERLGYFCADSEDSSEKKLVFNRSVALRDSWAKIDKKLKKS